MLKGQRSRSRLSGQVSVIKGTGQKSRVTGHVFKKGTGQKSRVTSHVFKKNGLYVFLILIPMEKMDFHQVMVHPV